MKLKNTITSWFIQMLGVIVDFEIRHSVARSLTKWFIQMLGVIVDFEIRHSVARSLTKSNVH